MNRANRSPAIIGGVMLMNPAWSRPASARPGASGGADLVDGVERGLCLLEERRAGRGHGHSARIAVEQPDADLGLESRDRLRQRRLRQLKTPRRARHLTLATTVTKYRSCLRSRSLSYLTRASIGARPLP